MNKIKKILCIRSDRFGEFLLTLPAIKLIKDSCPNVEIDLLAQGVNVEMVRGLGLFTNTLAYSKDSYEGKLGSIKLASLMRRNRYDCVIVFNPQKNFHVASFLAGVKLRVGYNRKLGVLLNKVLPGSEGLNGMHEVEKNIALVRLLDFDSLQRKFRLTVDHDCLAEEFDFDECFVLHPFSSDKRKEIDFAKWSELIVNLKRTSDKALVLVGAKNEQPDAEKFAKSFDLINLVGRFDLRELANFYNKYCILHVGLDSGPAHLAGVLDIPVISLFTIADAARWTPVGRNSLALKGQELDNFVKDPKPYIDSVSSKADKAFREEDLISVVVPTYNHEKFLKKAIDSVLAQTYENFELIVVDDCSTDSTAELMAAYADPRILYLSNENNSGPNISRNRGLALAKGKFVAFLDSDDYWYPNKLKRQYEIASSFDEPIFVYSNAVYIALDGNKSFDMSLDVWAGSKNYKDLYVTPPSNWFFSRSIVDYVGKFDEQMKSFEDIDYILRLQKEGIKDYFMQETLACRYEIAGHVAEVSSKSIEAREIFLVKHSKVLLERKGYLYRLYKSLAKDSESLGDYSRAKKYYKKAIVLKPYKIEVLIKLFTVYTRKKNV